MTKGGVVPSARYDISNFSNQCGGQYIAVKV